MTDRLLQSHNSTDDSGAARRRRCFVSREGRDRRDMFRFVYDAEQRLCWDAAEKLPGRGWWVALEKETLINGTRKLIARQKPAKKTTATTTSQTTIQTTTEGSAQRGAEGSVEEFLRVCALMLEKRCLSFLALARRAGAAVVGAHASLLLAREGHLRALLTTPQSSLDERRKIIRADRRAAVCCARFSERDLGRVFAREDAVYVGVGGTRGTVGLVDRLLEETGRFEKLLDILGHESTESLLHAPVADIGASAPTPCLRTKEA